MKKTKKTKHSVAMNKKRDAKKRTATFTLPETEFARREKMRRRKVITRNLRGNKPRFYEKVMANERQTPMTRGRG